jgi:FKBP-type peptidyl-prolyl cis-trans isomerase FkpA
VFVVAKAMMRIAKPPPTFCKEFTMPFPPSCRPTIEPTPRGARRALLIMALAALACAACGRVVTKAPADSSLALTNTATRFGANVTDLHIIELEPGSGAEAVPGKFVVVHYTGWLYDPSAPDGRGAQFDSTAGRNVAFGFFLGTGRVIAGWDEGLVGMRVGGQRTLVVPPGMAYGQQGGAGGIPSNATLLFDIELVDVRNR